MKIDERKCRYQTVSRFAEAPAVKPPRVKTTGKVEIYFDGDCLGNPGQQYGSFQVSLDGKPNKNISISNTFCALQ